MLYKGAGAGAALSTSYYNPYMLTNEKVIICNTGVSCECYTVLLSYLVTTMCLIRHSTRNYCHTLWEFETRKELV